MGGKTKCMTISKFVTLLRKAVHQAQFVTLKCHMSGQVFSYSKWLSVFLFCVLETIGL